MIGPNLSEWALSKRSLVVFLMILAVIAGTLSFTRLGRGEDPAFTFRTMIVAAAWPGATVEETLQQVTERLERTLQETDHLDRVRSYTTAGQTTIFVDLKQSTPPDAVPDVWYQVRKNIGDMRHTLPQGTVGPFFNDDFGDTFGIIYAFTADGFDFRELRDYVEAARSRLLQVPDVSKIEVLGAQDEQIFIEFSTERLAGLRLNLATILATLQAQNLVRPAGIIQSEQERVFLRVTGAFDSEGDIESVNIVVGRPDLPARRHRHRAPRLRRPAAADVPRQRPAGDRPGHRHARRRRHPGAGRERAHARWPTSRPTCRSASSRCWWPTRPSPWTRRSTTS